jgi:transforming growth factor-beta-induced protein
MKLYRHVLKPVLFLATFTAGCGAKDGRDLNSVMAGSQKKSADLIDTAEQAGSFKTLITAIRAAGLENTIRNAPELTVFAPTDEAFAALPPGTLDGLLANPDALRNVLLYHTVGGKVLANQAVTLKEAQMMNGERTKVTYDGMTLYINTSKVINTDILATNGVIHVIDKVLIPGGQASEDGSSLNDSDAVETHKDVLDVADAAGTFKTLLAAVKAADLEETLRSAKDITLFAPNDEAFAKIPSSTLKKLLNDKHALRNVLLYHVVGRRVSAAEASKLQSATMLNGKHVKIEKKCEGELRINDSKVIAADIDGINATVHVLDTVLMP